MPTLPAGDWITVSDAAAILGVTKNRALVFVKRGQLPAKRTSGRYFLILRSDVEAFARIPRTVGRPRKKV